jgi:RNA polymerase sigma-70 factor (sigma-E family)
MIFKGPATFSAPQAIFRWAVEVIVGEPDGFREFVVTRSSALLRTAQLLTGNESSAQDLVQAALLKTWARWEGIGAGAQEAYVRRVMVSTFLGWRRRLWHREAPVSLVPDQITSTDAFADADTRVAVATALAGLTGRQRAVVVLRYFDDVSEADAALALNCSVGTVKSQTSKALANLRRSPLRHLFAEEHSDDVT